MPLIRKILMKSVGIFSYAEKIENDESFSRFTRQQTGGTLADFTIAGNKDNGDEINGYCTDN